MSSFQFAHPIHQKHEQKWFDSYPELSSGRNLPWPPNSRDQTVPQASLVQPPVFLLGNLERTQYYDLTSLKRSHVRDNDEVVPQPEKIVFDKKIDVKFPKLHPYSSHQPKYSLFPNVSDPPEIQRRSLGSAVSSPDSSRFASSKLKGNEFQIDQITNGDPLKPNKLGKKTVTWVEGPFYELPKDTKQTSPQVYPTPPQMICPNFTARFQQNSALPFANTSLETATALENHCRAVNSTTTYDESFNQPWTTTVNNENQTNSQFVLHRANTDSQMKTTRLTDPNAIPSQTFYKKMLIEPSLNTLNVLEQKQERQEEKGETEEQRELCDENEEDPINIVTNISILNQKLRLINQPKVLFNQINPYQKLPNDGRDSKTYEEKQYFRHDAVPIFHHAMAKNLIETKPKNLNTIASLPINTSLALSSKSCEKMININELSTHRQQEENSVCNKLTYQQNMNDRIESSKNPPININLIQRSFSPNKIRQKFYEENSAQHPDLRENHHLGKKHNFFGYNGQILRGL